MSSNPIQPQFKLRLYMKGEVPVDSDTFRQRGGTLSNIGTSRYVDIEYYTAYPVEYEEQASLLNFLRFTIDKNADLIIHRLFIGQWVILFGGYYTPDGSGMRKVCGATITRIKTRFTDNGRISIDIEAMSYGFNQMGKDTGYNYAYPDTGKNARKFLRGRTSISLADLVKGIVEEDGMVMGQFSLPKRVAKTTFDLKNIRRQVNQSDWAFLNKLGNDYGCSVWTETVDGKETFNFVETTKLKETLNTDIQFLYVPQNSGIHSAERSEMQMFDDPNWNRVRLLRNVSVDEDINAAYAVKRSAMYFNKQTGEFEETIAEVTEVDGKKVITMYHFDEERVKYIEETGPDLADRIRRLGPFNIEWSSGREPESPQFARYYYKAVTKPYDESVAVFDKAFLGIKIKARCNQDLDIHSQRVYNVRGILRYSSTEKTEGYFLRGLTHIWDADGTWTDLDMIK